MGFIIENILLGRQFYSSLYAENIYYAYLSLGIRYTRKQNSS